MVRNAPVFLTVSRNNNTSKNQEASAERYDAHYGTGLIPQSAPIREDIVDFWRKYYQECSDNFIGDENILA